MNHWIMTGMSGKATAQGIAENLDRNLMTLSAARNYYSAYGVEIKGRTKDEFIRNLFRGLQP